MRNGIIRRWTQDAMKEEEEEEEEEEERRWGERPSIEGGYGGALLLILWSTIELSTSQNIRSP